MDLIVGLFKSILYFGVVFCFFYVINNGKVKDVRIKWGRLTFNTITHKISVIKIVLFGFIFGIYSVYITASPLTHDRKNYAYSFAVDRKLTPAMNLIFDILQPVTKDPKVLFFVISALMAILLLLACRINEHFKPKVFALLGVSNLLIFSFNGLKQAPAIGLVAIAISLWMKKKYVIALVLIAFATLFHESALITIPILVLLVGAKKRWVRVAEYFVLLLFVLMFPVMTKILTEVVGLFSAELLEEADMFLDESGSVVTNLNLFTALKGLPYYIISIYGLYSRKTLRNKIEHYDKYLVLSIFTSVMILLSAYMYWMFRFGLYFYFFAFVFFVQLLENTNNRKNYYVLFYAVFGSLLFINFRFLMQYFVAYGGF